MQPSKHLFLFLLALVLISCGTSNENLLKNKIFFPEAPDTARIQYLTSINTSKDIVRKQTWFEDFVVGTVEEQSLIKPYGICAAKNRIVVVDTKQSNFWNLNLSDRTFKPYAPTGYNRFKKPLVPFINNDTLYIIDMDRKEIMLFDQDNEYITAFGSKVLNKPTDIFINNNNIYVSDIGLHKIFIFSKNGYQILKSFPQDSTPDNSVEFLHSANHIYIKNDKIYVCDFGEFFIKVFDLNGKYLKSIGSYGTGLGQFTRPKGIALDNDENLYVEDAAFENVQVFNKEDKLLFFFGSSGKKIGNMNMPIRIALDYENQDFFSGFVDSRYKIKYLIYVTNQFGDDKIGVYGFLEPKN